MIVLTRQIAIVAFLSYNLYEHDYLLHPTDNVKSEHFGKIYYSNGSPRATSKVGFRL